MAWYMHEVECSIFQQDAHYKKCFVRVKHFLGLVCFLCGVFSKMYVERLSS